MALKANNGGNPWAAAEVAAALGVGAGSANFFYITASSRDYGFTEGTRDTAEISLTELGRAAVYPDNAEAEHQAQVDGFLRVDAFRKVLEHFGGDNLPESRFLENTLLQQFGIPVEQQDEFVDIFKKNCRFLGIGAEFKPGERRLGSGGSGSATNGSLSTTGEATVTVATPDGAGGDVVCFVIMPFSERDDRHQTGFFEEVLAQVFTPAATSVGFTVRTAKRQGSDVIQSTIVNDLLEADLVLADLTEHNPNVLFELGMRMAEDKPVALVRARGTGPIFDVDNMLRVEEYSPNLWPSTVRTDIPRIAEHIKATWDNRDGGVTFMKILRQRTA